MRGACPPSIRPWEYHHVDQNCNIRLFAYKARSAFGRFSIKRNFIFSIGKLWKILLAYIAVKT